MFKLIQLKSKDHIIFNDFEINFCPEDEIDSKHYTSLIIGSNGTGKSNLIKVLCEIFNFIGGYKFPRTKLSYSFEITYKLDYVYVAKYSKEDNVLIITKNGNENLDITNIDKAILPETIISSSYIFNDIYDLNYSNIDYHYLGIKSTTNNVFIKNPTKDLFANFSKILIEKVNKTNNYKVINSLFDKLNFERRLTVNYKIGNNRKLLDLIDLKESLFEVDSVTYQANTKMLRDYFQIEKIEKENKKVRFKTETIIRTIKNENTQRHLLFSYLLNNNEILKNLKTVKRGELIPFSFNWKKPRDFKSKNDEFKNHIDAFKILQDLEIIDFHNFEVTKKTNIDFNYVSSGEYHIIHTLINILSKVKQNSLVLLDEPEISLHPKWQIEYFTLLEHIIRGFKDSHFIVASHSHFLVSDLDKDKSSIIILEKTKDKIVATLREKESNTYGWSSEQILFEVFKVPTVRSFYISNIVSESINILSKSKPSGTEEKTLIENIKKLKEVKEKSEFKNFDPLVPIIDELIKR